MLILFEEKAKSGSGGTPVADKRLFSVYCAEQYTRGAGKIMCRSHAGRL